MAISYDVVYIHPRNKCTVVVQRMLLSEVEAKAEVARLNSQPHPNGLPCSRETGYFEYVTVIHPHGILRFTYAVDRNFQVTVIR